jgi:hypothetical protein
MLGPLEFVHVPENGRPISPNSNDKRPQLSEHDAHSCLPSCGLSTVYRPLNTELLSSQIKFQGPETSFLTLLLFRHQPVVTAC